MKQFNLSRESRALAESIKEQSDERQDFVEVIAHNRQMIDAMLENSIFTLLVQGNSLLGSRKNLGQIATVVEKTVTQVNLATLKSVENLRNVYGKELELYKKLISQE